MAILEPVVATLVANTTEFTASMDAAKAKMAELGAGGDVSGAEGALGALGGAGTKAGEDIAAGATVAEGGLRDTEAAAKDAGAVAQDTGGKLGVLGSIFGNMPGPIGEAASKTDDFRGSIDKAGSSSSGLLSAIGSIPVPVVAVGAALAGVAAVSVDMASKYQTATNQIAASEGITTGAAAKVGDAFLTTAGTVTFSAQQIATAFAAVAGQAKQVNGGALSAQQSLGLMKSAMDVAEASGTSLSGATTDITKTLQSFSLGINQAPLVSDVLYNAANRTGVGVDTLSSSLNRAKSQMGAAAPPVQDLGGLLLDLAAHGETGRSGISALGSAFTGIISPSAAVKKAQEDLGVSFMNSKGQLDPISQIIGELAPKLAGLSSAQAAAELKTLGFGGASTKLATTIQAGPAAYDKYVAAVEKTNSAHDAAEKASSGMKASFEKAKSAIEDAGVALGEKLMPFVTIVAQKIAAFAAMVVKDWPQISATIKAVFDVVKPILEGFIDNIKGVIEFIQGLVEFVKGVFTGHWGEAWNGIKKMFGGALEDMKGMLLRFFGPFLVIFKKPIDDVVGFFSALPGRILGAISSLGSMLTGFFSGVWGAITSSVTGAWGAIVAFFESIPGKLLAALAALGGLLLGWISDLWGTFKGWIEGAWNNEVAFWQALPGKILAALAALGGMLQGWISSLWGAFKGFIESAWNNEVAFWSALPGRIIGAVESLGGSVLSWIGGVFSGLGGAISSGIGLVLSFFSSLPGKIISAVGDGLTILAHWGEDIVTGIANAIAGAAGAIGKALVNAVTSAVSSVKSAVNSIPVIGPALGAIGLATGGYVTQPTLALVGEAGPEYVIPEALLKQNYSAGIGALPQIAPISSGVGGVAGAGGLSAQIVNQPINLVVNGQTLAQIVTQFQLRGARATSSVLGQYGGSTQTAAATSINTNAIAR